MPRRGRRAVWATGTPLTRFSELTSNDHLDGVWHARLSTITSSMTGDLVEAVIGAAHLACGFEPAADLALRWCAPDLAWTPAAGAVVLPELGVAARFRRLAFLGAHVLAAVAADALVRAWPEAPHRALSSCRRTLLSPPRLLDLPHVEKSFDVPHLADPETRYDVLQSGSALLFVEHGWEVSSVRLRELLTMDHTLSEGPRPWS